MCLKTLQTVQVCDKTAIRGQVEADQGCNGGFQLRKSGICCWIITQTSRMSGGDIPCETSGTRRVNIVSS